MSQHSTPRYPEEPSERELYLSELANSDEDAEALLSGGADVDDLIAAGVVDDYEPDGWGWQTSQEVVLEEEPTDQSPLTPEGVKALLDEENEWLVARGFRSSDWRSKRGYSDAPNQPH